MRRNKQQLSKEECMDILREGTSGVLSLAGDEEYPSYFRSVIIFGTIRILEEEKEKRTAIEKLAVKYAPEDTKENRENFIRMEWEPLCMLKMSMDHVSGKEAIELVRARKES